MDNSCIIYLSTDLEYKEVENFIKNLSKEKNIDIFINKNVDFNHIKQTIFPDGFLYFRYVVVVDFRILDLNNNAECINKFLNLFWNNNMAAIATCDYEDLLINNGGYLNKTIPYPILSK